jgi:hypothetical protein
MLAFVRNAAGCCPGSERISNTREWIQLFNGRDLSDWTPKFAKHDLGENFRNTFRVEEGLLKVRYDQWPMFDGEFGHSVLQGSLFVLPDRRRVPVRRRAVRGGPEWAMRNNGSCCTARIRERC